MTTTYECIDDILDLYFDPLSSNLIKEYMHMEVVVKIGRPFFGVYTSSLIIYADPGPFCLDKWVHHYHKVSPNDIVKRLPEDLESEFYEFHKVYCYNILVVSHTYYNKLVQNVKKSDFIFKGVSILCIINKSRKIDLTNIHPDTKLIFIDDQHKNPLDYSYQNSEIILGNIKDFTYDVLDYHRYDLDPASPTVKIPSSVKKLSFNRLKVELNDPKLEQLIICESELWGIDIYYNNKKSIYLPKTLKILWFDKFPCSSDNEELKLPDDIEGEVCIYTDCFEYEYNNSLFNKGDMHNTKICYEEDCIKNE